MSMKIKYIALCLLLALVSCQRDEEMESGFWGRVGVETIETSYSSVTLNCLFLTNITVTNARAYLSTMQDFSDANYYPLTEKKDSRFIGTIDGLETGTTYYLRYEISNRWYSTIIAEISEFTTVPSTIPTISTISPTEITRNIVVGGKIIDNGGLAITNCGVVYSMSPNPTIENGTKVESNITEKAYTCTLTNLDFATKYYARAYAVNENGTAYGEEICFTTMPLKDGEGVENGNVYVDLGLSVKWATMNVGAKTPEEYGDYFAWGETTTKRIYNWSTYKYCNGSSSTLTKYNIKSSYGTVDNKTKLDLSDDAARANWGGSWRMPTDAEITELINNCTWIWTPQNGKNGYKVTSKKNGNSIFFSAAGDCGGSSYNDAGSYGFYWSSSLNTANPNYAYYLDFNSSYAGGYSYDRCYGRPVRPVCP